LALNECGTRNLHTFNDATKLAGPTNEIKYGYLLFFVRDDPDYKRNEKNIWESLEDAAKRVRVVFAQVERKLKPKPKFLGEWGVV
jgi:broad specificity phosphatase PhoE